MDHGSPPMSAPPRLTLYKRITLVAEDARIVKVFYPVFPPDRNAGDVLRWLQNR
jgi:peroxiredoxin